MADTPPGQAVQDEAVQDEAVQDEAAAHPARDIVRDTTRDAFYGGRLLLEQPVRGHRAGTDAVLLAAAVPRSFTGLCHDVGAGVGAAGLGIALACPSAQVRLVENDPIALRLAEANIAANGLAGRAGVVARDLFDGSRRRDALAAPADLVVSNPPFHAAGRVRPSPDAGRRAAHVLAAEATLTDWLLACLDLTAAKGTLIVIHAPAALPEILAAFARRLGAVTLLPVHPRADAPASRVLVRGVKGSRGPFAVAAPLVLHEGDGFTATAARVHRGEAALAW